MDLQNFEENNIDTKKQPASHKIIIGLIIVCVAYYAGFQSGKSGYAFEPKEFKVVNTADAPKNVDYSLLWEAMNVVNDKYIEEKPTPEEYLYGAIRGAVAAAGDPYTSFFEPKDLESFKTDLKGSFDGIGAEVGMKNNNIVIVAPLDDSPAKKAGILAGDFIVKVNGEDTQGWTVEQAVSKIRGKKGTEVTLSIFREGKLDSFDVKIIRDKIEIKSVKWETKEISGKKVFVITVSRFGEDTKALFEKAVNEVLNQSVSGIIVDLRNNPGGYLQTSVDLASFWLDPGTKVVTEEKSKGANTEYKSFGVPRIKNYKTVVLINGGSASASEILAGALQDLKKATLIGEKSFGKGSVQELIDLKDGAAVKVTVARWVTPSGKNLNKEGLHPDVEVKLTEDDIKNSKDTQMEKALEIISN